MSKSCLLKLDPHAQLLWSHSSTLTYSLNWSCQLQGSTFIDTTVFVLWHDLLLDFLDFVLLKCFNCFIFHASHALIAWVYSTLCSSLSIYFSHFLILITILISHFIMWLSVFPFSVFLPTSLLWFSSLLCEDSSFLFVFTQCFLPWAL